MKKEKMTKSEAMKSAFEKMKLNRAGKIFKATGKIPNDIGNRKWRRKLEAINKK